MRASYLHTLGARVTCRLVFMMQKLPPRWAATLNAPILRIAMCDFERYVLRKLPRGPVTQIQGDGCIWPIDVSTIKPIKRGQVSPNGPCILGQSLERLQPKCFTIVQRA